MVRNLKSDLTSLDSLLVLRWPSNSFLLTILKNSRHLENLPEERGEGGGGCDLACEQSLRKFIYEFEFP